MTKREKFILERNYLFWYVKDPTKVSDESLVEAVLNLGDWDDVQKLEKLMGIEKIAEIFEKDTNRPRVNYDKKIINYFKLYFAKYA
ncbi:MAG: hypothetical protein A2288_03770 [Candidatus Moranbacteria bacterium RIFOXYA12_FULL_44_15]|nr:MAG: hypothetical protein A2309_07090 [Bacteroidetes bacterium RIFOXYB2_FULL_35_7]OGI29410.1 MAG: hypothetical protein A2288_03770 [Candidatus Moranbacteria bacterium RIFOXYA12_FULL_44_15]OGI35155.1 MAG: hypothetical protein A2259_02185 [Candidatus Moranbacteria bacterium RIFOXYA2_FULL_43_15]